MALSPFLQKPGATHHNRKELYPEVCGCGGLWDISKQAEALCFGGWCGEHWPDQAPDGRAVRVGDGQ